MAPRGMFYSRPQNASDVFAGFPLMNRDSPINRHISLVGTVRKPRFEALFVNWNGPNNAFYERVYRNMIGRADAMAGGAREAANLTTAAKDAVLDHVRYDLDHSEATLAKLLQQRGVPEDGADVELSEVIRHGTGVCRHMGMLAGALLEHAVALGVISGVAHFHRDAEDTGRTGHAWARFTDGRGNRWVIDPSAEAGIAAPLERIVVAYRFMRDDEAKPPTTFIGAKLANEGSGQQRLLHVVADREWKAVAGDLKFERRGLYSSYVAETADGREIYVGLNRTSGEPYVVRNTELHRGHNAAFTLNETAAIQLGKPLPVGLRSAKDEPSPVVRLIGVVRRPFADLTNAVDPKASSFVDRVIRASVTELVLLGKQPGLAPGTPDQRVAESMSSPVTVDIADALRTNSRRAWIFNKAGNCFEVNALPNGSVTVADLASSTKNGRRTGAVLTSLPPVSIQDAWNPSPSLEVGEVTRLVLERRERVSTQETTTLDINVVDTASVAAEATLASLDRRAALTLSTPTR